MNERDTLMERIRTHIGGDATAQESETLLDELSAWQARHLEPFAKLRALRGPGVAMPTDVFRFTRLAVHETNEDVRLFRTSGTTNGARGQHAVRDLALYDLAAERAARRMLFPDVERMRLVIIAPRSQELPDSSLSYMLGRFCDWFASSCSHVWPVDESKLRGALSTDEPIAILGTSFALVHAHDALGDMRFSLAPGSRIMQTGGFKGRSRVIEPDAMRTMLSERYGVPDTHIVGEYGMTELSSQMYETALRDDLAGVSRTRRYWAPPWLRVRINDPATLEPIRDQSGAGVIQLDDLANLDSVCRIQTADLGRLLPTDPELDGEGQCFELHGRDANAVPRGCSLATEEALAP